MINEEGYIERMIRGLSAMVAKATVGQRAAQTESLDRLDAAYGELFDIPAELLDVIEPSALRQLVRPERIAALIDVLQADAALAEASGNLPRPRCAASWSPRSRQADRSVRPRSGSDRSESPRSKISGSERSVRPRSGSV